MVSKNRTFPRPALRPSLGPRLSASRPAPAPIGFTGQASTHRPQPLQASAYTWRVYCDSGSPAAFSSAVWQDSGAPSNACLLYTSDAADEEDSVDLGGRRI